MISYLFVKSPSWTGYVEGKHLLGLLQKRMSEAASVRPTATGADADNAFVLDRMTPQEWLGVVRAQQAGGGTYWMKLGGRLLFIDGHLYVGDRGAVAGTRVAKDAWNDGIPPTYREVARQLARQGIARPAESSACAKDVRRLLDSRDGDPRATRANLLPVLTGAMFIAEPRRNEKAFAINLMLLDLVEGMKTYGHEGLKVFTWERVLWHPEALDLDSNLPNPGQLAQKSISKPQQGPAAAAGPVGPVQAVGGLHRVGGKMPASPTGGGTGGNPVTGAPLNYIHQKEVSIVVRWLAYRNQHLGWGPARAANGNVLPYHNDPYQYARGNTKDVFKKIKEDLGERIAGYAQFLS
jgi:hypothetical protein